MRRGKARKWMNWLGTRRGQCFYKRLSRWPWRGEHRIGEWKKQQPDDYLFEKWKWRQIWKFFNIIWKEIFYCPFLQFPTHPSTIVFSFFFSWPSFILQLLFSAEFFHSFPAFYSPQFTVGSWTNIKEIGTWVEDWFENSRREFWMNWMGRRLSLTQ